MPGFLNSRKDVAAYRRFLEQRLCFFDGASTHGSSGSQRQCPRCRKKWTFNGKLRRHLLTIEYCLGQKAGQAAAAVGCSRNTAQSTFRTLDARVTTIVKQMRGSGGIAISTEPATISVLKRIRSKPGRRPAAEAAARYLFFRNLDAPERLNALCAAEIAAIKRACLALKAGTGSGKSHQNR